MVGKKMEDLGAHGSIFLPTIFFATSNALPTSRSTSICRSTLTRFSAIRTSWTYWIPDARTPRITGTEELIPTPDPTAPRSPVHPMVRSCDLNDRRFERAENQRRIRNKTLTKSTIHRLQGQLECKLRQRVFQETHRQKADTQRPLLRGRRR